MTQSDNELAPCHCGSKPWGLFGPTEEGDCIVECHGCSWRFLYPGTLEETARDWNRLHPAPCNKVTPADEDLIQLCDKILLECRISTHVDDEFSQDVVTAVSALRSKLVSAPQPEPRRQEAKADGETHDSVLALQIALNVRSAELANARDDLAQLRAERKKAVTWSCAARPNGSSELAGNTPQECCWPDCGCDPYATKVIEALLESGRNLNAALTQPSPPNSIIPRTELADAYYFRAKFLPVDVRKRVSIHELRTIFDVMVIPAFDSASHVPPVAQPSPKPSQGEWNEACDYIAAHMRKRAAHFCEEQKHYPGRFDLSAKEQEARYAAQLASEAKQSAAPSTDSPTEDKT